MDYKVPIYGVSSVYQFEWTHTVYKFDDLQEAEEWLHTEEYKFAERELMNKEGAIKLAGEDAVNDPLEWENEYHG